MATDPIPEPLTNQEVTETKRPRLSTETSPLTADVREMPPALPPTDGRPATSTTVDLMKGKASEVAEQAQQKAARIKDKVSEVAGQAQQSVAETYDRAKEGAARTYEQASRKTADFVWTARSRAKQVMHDYPFHVIAGAAAVGFMAGVALRIWRSNRYE